MAEQKTKTVIEWLEQAKAHGYEWAQSAIEQVDEDKYTQVNSLSNAVSYFQTWAGTKEGHKYWLSIAIELRKKGL